jgi:hypothetical protein
MARKERPLSIENIHMLTNVAPAQVHHRLAAFRTKREQHPYPEGIA